MYTSEIPYCSWGWIVQTCTYNLFNDCPFWIVPVEHKSTLKPYIFLKGSFIFISSMWAWRRYCCFKVSSLILLHTQLKGPTLLQLKLMKLTIDSRLHYKMSDCTNIIETILNIYSPKAIESMFLFWLPSGPPSDYHNINFVLSPKATKQRIPHLLHKLCTLHLKFTLKKDVKSRYFLPGLKKKSEKY